MARTIVLALAWAGSVAGAWVLGGGGATGEAPGAAPRALPVERPAEAGAPSAAGVPAAPSLQGDGRPVPAPAPPPSEPAPPVAGAIAAGGALPDLSTFSSAEEAVSALMAYARARLAEGEKGHLELLRTLGRLIQDERLEAMFGSDEEAARHLYPMIKFLVDNDRQVASMTETVFRTMAEDPKALADLDPNALEPFTEGFGPMLPAILPEERMQRLRAWARKIVEAPEGALPPPVEKQRRDVERLLRTWVPPLTADQAAERLRAGDLPPAEAFPLLRRVPPEVLREIDVVSILGPLIEQGDHRAMRAVAALGLDKGTVAAIDARMYRSAERMQPWQISNYAQSTGRGRWVDARPFIEGGLRYGGGTTDAFAKALINLPERPPKEYVVEVLETYTLSDQAQQWLRGNFGLLQPPAAPR